MFKFILGMKLTMKEKPIKQDGVNKYNSRLDSELIRVSHSTPLIAPIMSIPASIAIAVVYYDQVSLSNLILWIALQTLAVVIRVSYLIYFRSKNPAHPIGRKWRILLVFTLGGFGAAWGASAYLLYVPDSYQMQIIIAAIVSVTAIFMTLTAPYLSAFLTYALLSMGPHIILFFTQETIEHYMTGAMLMILLINTLIVASSRRNTIKEISLLRFELAEQKEQAEAANLAKSKFLAAASHDLRQPLHALTIFTGTLSSRIKDEQNQEIVDSISNSVVALENLLNALLDISKLDAGAIIPKKETINLTDIVNRLEGEYATQAENKGLLFTVNSCNVSVYSDAALLETILRNLFSNAIRYTQEGSVTVNCQVKGEQVDIEVRDTGIGIPDNQQDEIFREFHQLHNSERDRSKGLGLGLAIVQRLVQLMGHELTLESMTDKGSAFHIHLPLRHNIKSIVETKPDILSNESNLPDIRVLVIDDDESILRGTRLLLEGWGIYVITAQSADQAINQLEEKKMTPDAILADFRLRESKTGIQAIEQIRNICDQNIPAILVTGDIAPERLKEASESEFTVLHKPVSPARIRAFIRQVQRQLADHSFN